MFSITEMPSKRKRTSSSPATDTRAFLPRTSPPPSTHTKLARLPDGYLPSYRPLSHPAIPPPASSATKIIYVSPRTPFVSALKRTQALLSAAEKRETQAALDKNRKRKTVDLDAAAEQLSRSSGCGEVLLKGSGKAIEKTLSLGLWFQSRDDYGVVVRTGSLGTVDDVVKIETNDGDEALEETEHSKEDEVPRSRFRYTSTVEVSVSRVSS